jgi:hypothetical protein
MSDDVRILTDVESADFLRLRLSQFARLVKSGAIARLELSDGQVRFLLSDLVAYVRAKRVAPVQAAESSNAS